MRIWFNSYGVLTVENVGKEFIIDKYVGKRTAATDKPSNEGRRVQFCYLKNKSMFSLYCGQFGVNGISDFIAYITFAPRCILIALHQNNNYLQ